ncbi:MAG TPA: DUF192 domain-containing protein [Acidimicrobiia bacterium]|nr:DUF192 domain-containing protein [Acidimicrobiia bacterium]
MKARLLVLMVSMSCSSATPFVSVASTTTASSVVPTTTTAPAFDAGDLTSFEPHTIALGTTELIVALADEESERQQGLAGVTDLGGFEGMLFAWDDEVTTGFWMKDTPIALDLIFFDSEGAIVEQTSLEPCLAEPCPVFVADGLFRWVLEAPAGSIQATGKLSFPEAD